MPLRGYAEQKKASCAGTQSRRRVTAWVRRAETGELRGYAEQQWLRCVPTVAVRGAIVHLGAYCTQSSRRRSAWSRSTAEGALRVYAEKQRVNCVATQASERKTAYLT